MKHIFNLSAIKELMDDKPRAQRIQSFMNKDDFDSLNESQARELVKIIEDETESTVKSIKDNVPFIF